MNRDLKRKKWLKDLEDYYKAKDALKNEIVDLQKQKVLKKKDLKWLKKDISKLERRLYER